jgi:hypothetical protein
MSVVIVSKFSGDTARFRQAVAEQAQQFEMFAERSKAGGAIHHRFAIGDGFVIVVDEWESVEQFQAFMADPELQAFIGTTGAAPSPPETWIGEAIESADQY